MADVGGVKESLPQTVDRLAPAWRDLALRIHAHPESGFEEYNACAWLSEALENAGFDVARGVADMPTSFAAAKDTCAKGPVVAFLAEYDALRSIGHACGHNLSGAASCLAAHALAEAMAHAEARLRVFGTPAEESGGGGKLGMLKHGVLDDVDFAMMAHAGHMNLASRDMLGRKTLSVEFRAPESDPDRTNALAPLLMLFRAADGMRDGLPPRARVDGIVTDGGSIDRGRVDLRRAQGQFLIRASDLDCIDDQERRLIEHAVRAAQATGTELCHSTERGPYLPMRRNAAFEAAYAANLAAIGEEVGVFPDDWAIGYTDFGNVSRAMPGIHAYFKAAEPGTEHHTPAYAEAAGSQLGLAGMVVAAKAMAMTGFDLLSDEALRERVRRDFGAAQRSPDGEDA